MRRTAILLTTAATAGALLAACGSSAGTSGASSSTSSSSAASGSASGTITVFAAASLKEAFTGLGRTFEAAHPGTRVVFSFGPSSGLATQITQGAPADVFASASTSSMNLVTNAGAASAPRTFATNVMEI